MPEAVLLLRSIYQLRELSEFPQDHAVSVRAPAPLLQAAGAMLEELGLPAATVEEIRATTQGR